MMTGPIDRRWTGRRRLRVEPGTDWEVRQMPTSNGDPYLDSLMRQHGEISDAIEAEMARPMPDFTTIVGLKKRKLAMKDQIETHRKSRAGFRSA